MVSGKPPRRSKSTDEPVTIDLTATSVPTQNGQPGETGPDAAIDPAAKEAQETASAVAGDPAAPIAGADADANRPALDGPYFPAQGEAFGTGATDRAGASEDKSAAEGSVTDDRGASSPANPVEEPAYGGETTAFAPTAAAAAAAAPEPASAGHGGRLLAGCVGGIVALVAAGALQYGGVLPTPGASAIRAEITSLTGEIDRLKASSTAANPNSAALEARLAKLESATPAAGAPTVDPAVITELQTRLAAANQAIDSLKSEVAGRVESLTGAQTQAAAKLDAIETKLNRPRDDVEVARAIAASALKTAADRGGPFLSELTTLGSIAPEDPAVAALQAYATTGVPSRTELLARFAPVASTILSTLNQPAESANIGERLWASAVSVIKVRPVGNVAGDTPDAILARVEDKIRNGDLKGAAVEWDSLPEAGRQAGAAFKKGLDDRIAVETNVADALARAVNGRRG